MSHGGRRHGLAKDGPARALVVRMGDDERKALEVLAADWGCSLAEAVRRCVRQSWRLTSTVTTNTPPDVNSAGL